jgi:hypothetical protein
MDSSTEAVTAAAHAAAGAPNAQLPPVAEPMLAAPPIVQTTQREFERRGRLAFEAGDQALGPSNALPSGHAAGLAVELYRQSAYWAVLALKPELGGTDALSAVWNAACQDAQVRSQVVCDQRLLLLLATNFTMIAELSHEEQVEAAGRLRSCAAALLAMARRPVIEREWLRTRRALIVFCALLIFGFLLTFALDMLRSKPDLAAGKPWRASSELVHCEPDLAQCGGAVTKIFFHTKQELNPWVRYDLGAPRAFSSLTVRNRSDFGPERAVPLVAEVSNDDEHFSQIARQDQPFTTWEPHFPRQNARYVRLRVARESMLHLEAVEIHP